MKNRKTRSAMRRMLFTLALVLVVAVASVGGTIAWLTDKTDAVTNTFTVGDINIELKETLKPDGTEVTAGVTDWSAKLIPGKEYSKNPVVSVKAGSEDCYLFVKFEENNNPSSYLNYTSTLTSENGWTKLEGVTDVNDVWYRVVKQSDTLRSWNLIADNKVTVKNNVVKSGTDGTDVVPMPSAGTTPELKYTAYAVQQEGSAAAVDAWAKLNP